MVPLQKLKAPSGRSRDEDIAALFDAGQYTRAAELYDAAPRGTLSIATALIRARIYLRSDAPSALKFLHGLRPPKGSAQAVRRDTLLGEAYALSGDYAAADDHLRHAQTAANKMNDPDLVADAAYHRARRHIMSGDAAKAREAIRQAQAAGSLVHRLDVMHTESAVMGREGRHRDQARLLMELLAEIDPNGVEHMEHRVFATHSLAMLAREMYLPQAAGEIERHLGGTPWPDDFRVSRFSAAKALGWCKALQGDYFNAFRFLKEAAAAAPSDGWRVTAFADRAYLAEALGEERWARQELRDAEEAADATRWELCTGEEPVALLLLAKLFAPIDPGKASAYLAQFRRLGETLTARHLFRNDERYQALISEATGIVDAALDNRKLAVQRLREAKDIYDRNGYDWRAASCALQIYDLSRSTALLDFAREKLQRYSNSWLADQLRARTERDAKPQGTGLTRMQERIFRMMLQGQTNGQMAEAIGRAENTVANHAKAVLKAFGVSTRTALLAEAVKRGLFTPDG